MVAGGPSHSGKCPSELGCDLGTFQRAHSRAGVEGRACTGRAVRGLRDPQGMPEEGQQWV